MYVEENNKNKNRKVLFRALIQLAACGAVLLVCLPFVDALAPLRKAIWLPLGKKVGPVVAEIVIIAAVTGAIHALSVLARLLNQKLHMPLDWGKLLYGLGLLAFGLVALIGFDSFGFVIGLGLTAFGGYQSYRVIKETRSSMILDRDGETVVAEIYNITRSSFCVDRNGDNIYTVYSRADGRVFTKKTSRPMGLSNIGKKVYVRISSGSPDVYDVDLDSIVSEPEKGSLTEVKKTAPMSNVDTSAYVWRWNKPSAEGSHVDPAPQEPPEE